MFLIHPIFQTPGILIALYVFTLGMARFRMVHLGHKVRFNWKRHVRFGMAAAVIWLIGTSGGLYVVKTSWYVMLVTGVHGKIGLAMIPFILFALGSGLYMDRKKAKRKVLPVIHAVCNTVLLLLALSQIYTGIGVYRTYVLGL